MTPIPRTPAQILAWTAALDAVAVVGSLALSCLMPFAALATVSALTLRARVGVLTVLVAWGLNQAIGYGLLGYPSDPATIARGLWTGVAALAGFGIAGAARGDGGWARAGIAFVAAFVGYEATMFAGALALGGVETFAWRWMRLIAINEACWFAGLIALNVVLTTAAPRGFGRRPAFAPA